MTERFDEFRHFWRLLRIESDPSNRSVGLGSNASKECWDLGSTVCGIPRQRPKRVVAEPVPQCVLVDGVVHQRGQEVLIGKDEQKLLGVRLFDVLTQEIGELELVLDEIATRVSPTAVGGNVLLDGLWLGW